jgi:hypothetical protein
LGLTDKNEQLLPLEEIYGNWLNNSNEALGIKITICTDGDSSQLSNENKAAASCQNTSI